MKQKQIFFFSVLILIMMVSSCTTSFNFFQAQWELTEALDEDEEKSDVAFNFCVLDSDDLACNSFNLTSDSLTMELEVLSSDIASVDSVVFELPDIGYYCTADTGNGFLTTSDEETYTVFFTTDEGALEDECDFSSYVGQDVQLLFEVTETLSSDGSTVTEEGDATDTIFADE
jgi:hypothetical protein